MTDAIPLVTLGLGADSQYVVMVGEQDQEARDVASLMALAPGLMRPAAALEAARFINHMAQGPAFDLITDPAAYAAAYRARVDAEDPNENWSQNKVRLRDYGMPDFDQIKIPVIAGSVLTYFAADSHMGVPYKVLVDLARPGVKVDADSYDPLDLTPLSGAADVGGPGGSGIQDEDSED